MTTKPNPELPADRTASGNVEDATREAAPEERKRPERPLKSQEDFEDERSLGAPRKKSSKWDRNGWSHR